MSSDQKNKPNVVFIEVFSFKFYSPIDFNSVYCFILVANPFTFSSDEAAVSKFYLFTLFAMF